MRSPAVAAALCSALSVLAVPALATPVGLAVGEVKHVNVSQRVAKVAVSDSSRVEVSHQGGKVTLVGKAPGRSNVQLITVDGAEVSLELHVVSPGGRVFVVKQNEAGRKAASLSRGEKVRMEAEAKRPAAPAPVRETETETDAETSDTESESALETASDTI